MKTFRLTVLLLFLPLVFFGQTLTGLWVGSVTNDSITVRKDQAFEIVLTQYKNKVYGFSRSSFIVNDSLFYIVKRVKGTIEGNVCEVKDDEIVSYNFKGRLDKGVKMTTTFRFDRGDSTWRMDGDWKTNQTKKYYSLSGKATLNQEKDLDKSKILPHLEELKLADNVEFYAESKKAQEQTIAAKQPEKSNVQGQTASINSAPVVQQPETKTNAISEQEQPAVIVVKRPVVTKEDTKVTSIDKDNNVAAKPKSDPAAHAKQPPAVMQTTQPLAEEKTIAASAQNNRKDNPAAEVRTPIAPTQNNTKDNPVMTQVKTNPSVQTNQPRGNNPSQTVSNEQPKKTDVAVVTKPVEQKPAEQKPATVFGSTTPQTTRKETVATETGPIKQDKQPVVIVPENKPVISPAAATMVTVRKTTPPQIVNYKSDSLILSLYDNGEVDGDTVSVLLNGEIIIAKECLKVSAIKKTIYVPAEKGDSLTLVLYAENLGKYPPNTGLLIVRDGNDSYQIRFSADLQQNASIILRRKRN